MEKVVLITGATKGIGKATARVFAENGASIILNYSSDDIVAKKTMEEIQSFGVKARIFKANVANSAEVKEMFQFIKKEFGQLDILVNNAGVTADGLLMLMNEDAWNRVIDVNLKGAFLCSRQALRLMIANKRGVIINVGSVSSIYGTPGQTNYAASKGGIVSLTRALSKEVISFGIRVNAVIPGLIDTEITRSMDKDKLKHLIEQIPLKRLGTPDEVAEVIYFLSSEKASYIVGQVIIVDGGLS